MIPDETKAFKYSLNTSEEKANCELSTREITMFGEK